MSKNKFEFIRDDSMKEGAIRCNAETYTAIFNIICRLASELTCTATPPPRTYEQGAEDMRERAAVAAWSKGMELNGRVFDPRDVGSACAKSIRALPTQLEGEGE